MELIARIRQRLARLRYVYGWRLRYWWLDTRNGLVTRISLAITLLIGVITTTVYGLVAAHQAVRAGQPHEAVIPLVVWLIIAMVAAAIAVAMMPKPKPPQPQQASTPTVADGQTVVDLFGTGWFDDSFILAWSIVGRDPIKATGGKK